MFSKQHRPCTHQFSSRRLVCNNEKLSLFHFQQSNLRPFVGPYQVRNSMFKATERWRLTLLNVNYHIPSYSTRLLHSYCSMKSYIWPVPPCFLWYCGSNTSKNDEKDKKVHFQCLFSHSAHHGTTRPSDPPSDQPGHRSPLTVGAATGTTQVQAVRAWDLATD